MFSLRGFIKRGLLDAVGKQPDYWVILNAAGWLEKGVLTEEDLAEIQTAIEETHTVSITETEAEAEEAADEEDADASDTIGDVEDGADTGEGDEEDVSGN